MAWYQSCETRERREQASLKIHMQTLSNSHQTYISGNKKRSRLYFYTPELLSFNAIEHNFLQNTLALIINGCREHVFPYLLLTIISYQQSHLISPLDGKKCRHGTNECKFLPVSQHWCDHVFESIGERHL